MKITKDYLKQVIKEELESVLREEGESEPIVFISGYDDPSPGDHAEDQEFIKIEFRDEGQELLNNRFLYNYDISDGTYSEIIYNDPKNPKRGSFEIDLPSEPGAPIFPTDIAIKVPADFVPYEDKIIEKLKNYFQEQKNYRDSF